MTWVPVKSVLKLKATIVFWGLSTWCQRKEVLVFSLRRTKKKKKDTLEHKNLYLDLVNFIF